MADVIHLWQTNIQFEVATGFSKIIKVARVVWAKHLVDNVYHMSLYFKQEDYYMPYLVAVYPDGRFVPLPNGETCYFSVEEKTAYDYMKQLGVDKYDAHEKLMIARANKWKEQNK